MKRYEALADDLAASIDRGLLKPGDRLPSVRDLTRRRGVSPATVFAAYARLEARGLMQRNASAQDRRVRLLTLTAAGGALLAALVPAMLQAQQRILSPLPEAERGEFMRMLAVLIAGHRAVEDTPGAG